MESKYQRRCSISRDLLQESDINLVEACKRGSEEAFEVLYRRYSAKVFAIALSITRRKEDALDIVQEAFTKVFRHLKNFKGESSFYTWLYRITMNVCIDTARRRARVEGFEYTEKIIKGTEGESTNMINNNPGEDLHRKELMEHLQNAIESLPSYHRQVIIMREIGGMSYEEIAKAMKVSKGTVMSRLFHARRKIREKMDRYFREDKK